jgi:hypothetical protein
MLRNVKVREAITAHDGMMAARLEVSRERWLREVAAVAFADARDFRVGPDGVALAEGVPEEFGGALTLKVRITRRDGETETTVEYATADKSRALALLGKHLGLLQGKAATDRPFEFTLEQLERAARRAEESGLLPPIPRPQPKPITDGGGVPAVA